MMLPTAKSRLLDWWYMGRPLLPLRFYHKEDGFSLSWLGRWSNAWKHHTRALRPGWLRYALTPEKNPDVPYWRLVWCRYRGHPNGEVYFNAGGMEPDHHCKDCGEIIG